MEVSISTKTLSETTADTAVLFFLKEHLQTSDSLKAFPAPIKTLIHSVIAESGFTAEAGSTVPVHTKASPRLIILVGCGPKETFTLDKLRTGLAAGIRTAAGLNTKELAVSILAPESATPDRTVTALAEIAHMTLYKFDTYKSDKKPATLKKIIISDVAQKDSKALTAAVEIGETMGSLNTLTRELVNTPPGICTPAYFAAYAEALGKKYGFSVKVYDEKQLLKMNMHGILAVGAGGRNPPRLVVAEYKGDKGKDIAFVGKGVCFDSGGLDIKPASAMDTMKMDKAGACAALHALAGCAKLKLKGHFSAFMPLVENMTGDAAYKPGDIITTRSKKTIEVLNTDAEGRVILADALYFAAEQKPDAIIDLATLTGACVVALGTSIAGIMTNNPDLARDLKAASGLTYERLWELPMDDDFMEPMKSEHADVRNVTSNIPGSSSAGTITAAKFLSVFVENVPWAHLDIAGPAWSGAEKGYHSTGATGFGTRLLIQYAIDLNRSK